jgi:hypothetical protein
MRKIFICLALSLSFHVFAQEGPGRLTEIRGFKVGMSVPEAKSLAKKLFGPAIDKHCAPSNYDIAFSCDLSTVYGNHQDDATKFIPKKGAFEIGRQELRDFRMDFFQGKLYKLSGRWQDTESKAAMSELLRGFTVKFGEPQQVQKIKPSMDKSDVANPLFRLSHSWAEKQVRLKFDLEAVEYPYSSQNSGFPVISTTAEFELYDDITQQFIEKENRQKSEQMKKKMLQNGWHL